MRYSLKDFLFLFDIDGTILETNGCGKRSLLSAIEEVFNIKADYSESFAGGIDCIFFKNYYDKYGQNIDFEKSWLDFKRIYSYNLKNSNKDNWNIFQNVYQTIEFLYKYSNIALATGNIIDAAYIKLENFNLHNFFCTGGFGENVETRDQIVKNAISNSEEKFNKKFDKKKIFLFGDTEKDIISAINNQITPILTQLPPIILIFFLITTLFLKWL